MNQDQSARAIVRQKNTTDLDGTPRGCWEFTGRGQLYYLAEAEGEPQMLVKKGPARWEYVPPEHWDQVLDAFRAEWAKGNRTDKPARVNQAGGNDRSL